MLYNKLLKFREDQLENYQGPPIEYSVSDYHHAPRQMPPRPLSPSSPRSSLEGLSGHQRGSQFSISKGNTPPRNSKSYKRQPSVAETERSYDPYRTSRNRIARVQADHARITVLRGTSGSHKPRTSVTSIDRQVMSKASVKNPALSGVSQADAYSLASSPPVTHNASRRQLNASINERHIPHCASRRSLSSNVAARTSLSYKRGVSFAHMRKRSVTTQNLPVAKKKQYGSSTLQERYIHDRPNEASSTPESHLRHESPQSSGSLVIHLPKNTTRLDEEAAIQRVKTESHYWKEDARKVSTDFEKTCDEAFNRSSMASSVMTATSEPQERYHDTPATSIGVQETSRILSNGTNNIATRKNPTESSLQDRPLPMPPSYEEFGSFTYRELAKTRAILKKRATDTSMNLSPGYFDDVIAHLDRLMQPSTIRIHEADQRVASAPIKGSDSEQSKEFEKILARGQFGLRSTSDPIKKGPDIPHRHGRTTIRVVGNQTPISPTKPLTIRKKSGSSTTPSTETVVTRNPKQGLYHIEDHKSYDYFQGERRSAGLSLLDSALEPIEEDEDRENRDSRGSKTYSGEIKKRSWFRRHEPAQRSRDGDMPPLLPPKDEPLSQDYQDIGSKNNHKSAKRASNASSEGSRGSDPKKASSGRGIFFKIFSKRDSKESKSSTEQCSGGKFR